MSSAGSSHLQPKIVNLRVITGLIISFLLFMAAVFCGKIFSFFGLPFSTKENSLFYSRIILWAWFLFLCFYVIKIEKQKLILGEQKEYPVLFYILSIIALLLSIIIISTILAKIESFFGLNDNSKRLGEIISIFQNNKPLLLFTILTAAILEELYFRAYLVPRLELLLKSSFLAILISSVLFSIAHIGFGNAAQMINTGFIGIISAWYFVKYRNIKILIATHFLIDLIGVYSKFR